MRFMLFLTLVILSASSSLAEDNPIAPWFWDPSSGKISLQETIQAEGRSKSELFKIAQEWIVHAYRDSDAVTQLSDEQGGKLVVRGWGGEIAIAVCNFKVYHDLTITVKEGRWRYTYDRIVLKGPCMDSETELPIEQSKLFQKHAAKQRKRRGTITRRLQASAASLKIAMSKPYVEEDW